VPCAADDGDVGEEFFLGFADGAAHPGFAEGIVVVRAILSGRGGFAEHGHGVADGVEDAGLVLAVLDDVFPPALAVVEAGATGEIADGVEADLSRSWIGRTLWRGIFFVLDVEGEAVGLGEVHEADGGLVFQGPADGVPLGGEVGEGVVDGALRFIDGMNEDGHGRLHVGVGGERDDVVGVGGTFDEEAIGFELIEGIDEGARGAGAVVADAEDGGF